MEMNAAMEHKAFERGGERLMMEMRETRMGVRELKVEISAARQW